MSDSKTQAPHQLLLAWVAMLIGLSMLLLELMTGLLNRMLPSFLVWASYLLFLLTSVWGMKSLLEWQGSGTSTGYAPPQTQRFRKSVSSRNLWKLPMEGQVYLVMSIIMLLGALFGRTNTLMLMFALMAGPFIVNGGVTFALTRKLMIQRKLPERVMAGEIVSIDVELINHKRVLSSSLVSVEDRITGPRELLFGKLMFTYVPARDSRNGRYQARFMHRGKYRLGPTRIVSRFPLGIVERGRQIECYDDLIVYPRIGILAESWRRRLSTGQEVSRSAQGRAGAHHDEFHRIREYRTGDELRSIHWKTTARRNELMVKEYRENRDRRMLLVLDLSKPSKGEATEETIHARCELAASLAATIGWLHIQECGPQQMDLLCFGESSSEWLGHSRGERSQGWLDELALIQAGDQFSTQTIEQEIQRHLTGETRCVLVTSRTEQEFYERMQSQTKESQSSLNQVLVVEADPAKTEKYFSL